MYIKDSVRLPLKLAIGLLVVFVNGLLFWSCTRGTRQFELLSPDKTGVEFANTILESDTFNVLRFEYIYNGGGVGVADFNNDGLTDIFFAGNMVTSRLYLNQGDFRFHDVTEKAQVTTRLWCTGVALVDINEDGLVDIHVSTIHPDRNLSSPNLFFINRGADADGIPKFEEVAETIGLADSSYSTQAAFLDYDLDGDLDVYLVNNALEDFNRNTPFGQRHDGGGKSMDRLFRNEGIGESGLPLFRDVSNDAGIKSEGWGLGVAVNDFNNDGFPDIYVANDFLSNDLLYINQGDGTFVNRIDSYLKHQEHNGMGVDIADINNDALNDIVVTDMMPDDNLRQKTMFANTGYDRFQLNRSRKYQTQYVRNVLQLNNGNGTFSDIGYLAGIYATDWSWSTLIADLDNDGLRDILITNGYRKDVTDLDFIAYSQESSIFGTDETRLKNAVSAVNELAGVKKPNFVFKNRGDLRFSDATEEWAMDQPSYSNGAAYADLDNDGDLDLVINNINDNAFIYRNNTSKEGAHYLRVQFAGKKSNPSGIGAKVFVYSDSTVRYAEHQVCRGYKSTVEPVEHFGLGSATLVDSVIVIWPGNRSQTVKNVSADQTITLMEKNAVPVVREPGYGTRHEETLLVDVTDEVGLNHSHKETEFVDFKRQPLLLHKHSQAGPGIAVGDVDRDGLEDFVVGGAANESGQVFFQKGDGTFSPKALPAKKSEDTGLLLFDADGDGDLDLYCVSGSSEFGMDSVAYQDRLYRNNAGIFSLDESAIPDVSYSGGCVNASDFDKDGDLDLFVSGRVVPGRYPAVPKSYLLANDGTGRFSDKTRDLAPDLEFSGMVAAGLWTDVDNDGWVDLLAAGEWTPLMLFQNKAGRLVRSPISVNDNAMTGWWNSITGADIDRDGDVDYFAGNTGLNSIFQPTEAEPVRLYAKDFDSNGSMDPVATRFIDEKEYITHPRETLTDQIVSLRKRLTRYSLYGKKTLHEVFTSEELAEARVLASTHFASSYFLNSGNLRFDMSVLPVRAQLSPVYGMILDDINGDEKEEVLAIGNSYASEPLNGWLDAGIGVTLQHHSGSFESINVARTGLLVDGDAKAFVRLNRKAGPLYIASQNNDKLKAFKPRRRSPVATFEPQALDTYAELHYGDGTIQKVEFHYGSGYLSQSTRAISVPSKVSHLIVYNSKTGARRVASPELLNSSGAATR